MTEQMRARPLIGVSTSEVRRDPPETEHGEPERQEMVLGIRYLRAIEAAGGLPMVMPPLAEEAIDPLLDRLGGICLSGGPDLDPRAYGAAPHEELGPTEPTLDHFELALARRADERGLPVLAVCRGMQLLNVARGGTLHQHLPEVVGPRLTHRQSEPCGQPTHWVRQDADSALSRLMSRRRAKVNSFHHQALRDVADGLLPVAWASDGTIEAVEDPERDFVVGVQWHAECLAARPQEAAVFRALVDAARRRDGAEAPLRRVA